jgi:hypothetical protein
MAYYVIMLPIVLFLPLALAQPPSGLHCITKYYNAAAKLDGGWWAVLPDGVRLPWDDGRAKSAEERLAHPDLEDLFAQRYRGGPIRPVTTADEEPGRVRVDALFRATYPRAGLTPIELFGHSFLVHQKVAAPLRRVVARLAEARRSDPALAPFLDGLGGTFAPRKIAGTDRTSAHSWGISIDLNPSRTQYWRWDKPPVWHNTVPQVIVDAFEAEGFIWGGRWYHYDTMHFEYRPELLDAACYP